MDEIVLYVQKNRPNWALIHQLQGILHDKQVFCLLQPGQHAYSVLSQRWIPLRDVPCGSKPITCWFGKI
ncbi:MAG: hypothetical protein ACI9PU_000790 [Ascidiaceihabitans sp.]|jgi:hypothetical protein